MADEPETPFDNIESAHEYVGLLCEALREARDGLEQDVAEARSEGATRRLEALQIVSHKLDGLSRHLETSHRLLNDLRTLRRLLLRQRVSAHATAPRVPPEE
jgi:hypothetical protein